MNEYDAVIVGSGPNGLAAGIVLARAGLRVLIREAADEPGGGARTSELTIPGFSNDVCSAVHPLGLGSPFFRQLPLSRYGLEWIRPPAAVAHPLDDGSAVLLEHSTAAMEYQVGPDGRAWRALMDPFVRRWEWLFADALGPLKVPRHPILLARFGLVAFPAATWLTRVLFRGERAPALFGGIAAHATVRLRRPPSAAFGMILGLAGHAVGWPIPRGGSASITRALVEYFRSLGGQLQTGARVDSLDELPSARAVLLDLTPREILRLEGTELTALYRAQLEHFQYGLGTFKVDWALDAPIPWRAPQAASAATVHLGGTLDEMDRSREQEWTDEPADRPFVLVVQPTLFDKTRAPEGKHVGWAYCHLPNGSSVDMTERLENQVERFAPGFRDRIIARHVMSPADFERYNPNMVGGDLSGGEATLLQLFFPAGAATDTVRDTKPTAVHLLVVHAARRRRPRHVWLLGSAARAAASLLLAKDGRALCRRSQRAVSDLETVLAWHAALNAANTQRVLALSSADVEVGGPRGGGRGADLLRDWIERAGIRLEPRRTVEVEGEHVIVVEQSAQWPTENGGYGEPRTVASVFRLRDGKIESVVRYADFASARTAAGLGAEGPVP
jgi:phytoene dehydrogenase-like protein